MSSLQDAFNWAVDWCNRANVGYDQDYRNMQVHNGVTWFDCSSFTFFALWQGGGFDVGSLGYSTNLSDYTSIPNTANAWVVHTMEQDLPSLGWTVYNIGQISPQAGDIVVKHYQHCEMVYSTSPLATMGARNPDLPLADQVSIHTVTDLSWYDRIWRYGGTPPTPPTPGAFPPWLMKRAKMNQRKEVQIIAGYPSIL